MTSPVPSRLATLTAALAMLGSVGFLTLPPAMAQSVGGQTCRSAIGEDPLVTRKGAVVYCCMVVSEKQWYDDNDIVISRVYDNGTPEYVRPKLCKRSELVGGGGNLAQNPTDEDDDDDGDDGTTPNLKSLGSSSGDDDGGGGRTVYY